MIKEGTLTLILFDQECLNRDCTTEILLLRYCINYKQNNGALTAMFAIITKNRQDISLMWFFITKLVNLIRQQ